MISKIIKGFAVILASSASVCSFSSTKGDYGYGTVYFEPAISGNNYKFTAKFEAKEVIKDGYFQRIYFASNVKSNGTLYYGTLDGSKTSNTGKYTISADWFGGTINRLYFIRSKNESRCGLPIMVDLNVINAFSITPNGEDKYVFAEPTNCRSRLIDSALNKDLASPTYYGRNYQFVNFNSEIECEGGLFPFSKMLMDAYDKYESNVRIYFSSAYLLIKKGSEYFSIGEEVPGEHGEVYRKIPLKTSVDPNKKTCFHLDRKYYLEPGRCLMREASTPKKGKEITTNDLYLPYSKDYKPLEYEMEIVGENINGLKGCNFSYSFFARSKTKSFGGCLGSEYCVGVY